MTHVAVSDEIYHKEDGLVCTISEGDTFTYIVSYQGDLRDVPQGMYRDGVVSFKGHILSKAQKYVLLYTYLGCRCRLSDNIAEAAKWEAKVDALVAKDEGLWEIESEIQAICLGL